ncbi:TonB-dependent receptor [Pseudomonas alcaligenes]|uniref:TonB-dependent receptor n=1 Tax=Aquipseudomonas alcaligenes TaxID=43263 RepID=A0ABR7RVU9_AQUAC|nr:TonB-dependent siderophore receptor [Pseudomonas alcaligenes]MBC9249233.1 TonB-dependent receptor [Pseudomonas alcaligenes]
MFKLTPLTVQILSIIALGSASAQAAESVSLPATSIVSSAEGSEEAQSYQAKPASTTTRLGLTPRETPQGVSSVPRQQLDDFKLNSIKDVLASSPSVTVEKVETDRTYFTSRGFDITNFQYDGTGMPFSFGLLDGDVDLAAYEQVDILHGANGLMTGAGNPSATVNFVRKRPTYTPQAKVDLSAGSWDKRRVDIDVSGPLSESGNVRGRLIYANEKGNSYLDRYSKEKNVLSGLLAFDLSDADTLTVGYEDQKSNPNGVSWGALPLTDASGKPLHYGSASDSIAQDWAYWDVHTQRAFAEWEHEFANDWKSKLSVTGVDSREDSQMFYIYSDSYSATGFSGLPSQYKDKTRQLLGDLSLSGPFSLGGREHQLTVGANWGRSRTEEASRYNSGSYYTPVSLDDALNGDIALPSDFDIHGGDSFGSSFTDRQKSLYSGARFSLSDDLSLIAGARMLSADSDGLSYGAPREVRIHGKVTPYAGLVYDLNEEYSLYASYTEIFNPQYYRDSSGSVLDPLEGQSYEAGIKGELLDKRLNVSAAVFHAKQKNVSSYAGYDASIGGSYYAAQDYDSSGIELEASGEVAPGLQLVGGYTYVYITDAEDDRARKYVPRHSFKSALTYRLPMLPQVKVGGSASWQSKVESDSNAAANQDAYALLGLMASYDIDQNWSTALNLNNLTNEKYLQTLYTGSQSNYGDPRNVTASLSWKY